MDLFYASFCPLIFIAYHHDALLLIIEKDFRSGMELRLFVSNFYPPIYIDSLEFATYLLIEIQSTTTLVSPGPFKSK